MIFKRYFLTFTAAFALAACETTTQYTSGADYLARYQNTSISTQNASTDLAVRDIAAIEPDLRFPARIGLARIGEGQNLTTVPFDEAESWRDAAQDLGPAIVEFIPVSPPVANSVSSLEQKRETTAIAHLRRGEALQHLLSLIPS